MFIQFISERLSWISCLISIVCILYIWRINYEIAVRYLEADGKTKALVGLTELSFSYKHYLLLPALIGLAAGIVSRRKKQNKTISVIAIVLAGLAIVLVFLRVWRLMI